MQLSTSLRYTDILFGFVIRELFLRIPKWLQLSSEVRGHLIVGLVLVLGSWIGYRRSLNRSAYEVKFFNLPLWRFIADQLMLILYFSMAVLTPASGDPVPVEVLTRGTLNLVTSVFVLYVVWDLLGMWMAWARIPAEPGGANAPRYPAVENKTATNKAQRADWQGFWASSFALLLLALLKAFAGCFSPLVIFGVLTALLVVYRMAKEIRTSWRSLSSH